MPKTNDVHKKAESKTEFQHSVVLTLIIVLALMIVSTMILLTMPAPAEESADIALGKPLRHSLYSQINFREPDRESTMRAEALAEARVPLYYKIDSEARQQMLNDIGFLRKELGSRMLAIESNQPYLAQERANVSDPQIVVAVERLSLDTMAFLRIESKHLEMTFSLLEDIVRRGIMPQKEHERKIYRASVVVYDDTSERIAPEAYTHFYRESDTEEKILGDLLFGLSSEQDPKGQIRSELRAIFTGIIRSDLTYDKIRTEAEKEKARKSAQIFRVIKEGQVLLEKTDALTEDDMLRYKEYMAQFYEYYGKQMTA